VDLHVLTEDDDPASLARDAVATRDVVVAGGDGTVGPVAEALAGGPEPRDATLGILAMGSWNNIGRGLGIPTDLEPALDAIARGATAQVDVGLAWHPTADEADGAAPPDDARVFLEAAGVGLDAAGFGAVERGGRSGWWQAGWALWRALRRRRTAMLLEVDGRRLGTNAPAVTICNGPYHGMGFALVPDADPTDGMLDVAVFSGMSRLEVLRHFLAVARGGERHEPRVNVLRARRITVRGARRVVPAHADGRSLGVTPVTFEVRPGRLRVFR
jgi:diacylglycerol kinase (ATP)